MSLMEFPELLTRSGSTNCSRQPIYIREQLYAGETEKILKYFTDCKNNVNESDFQSRYNKILNRNNLRNRFFN